MQSILGNTRKPDITFHACGRIDISARVSGILNLSKGDVIDVMGYDREYYLYVKFHAPVVGRHEASCFPTNRKGKSFRAWSKRLCRAILELINAASEPVELSVGESVTLPGAGTALPIIYKNILNQ